MDEQAGSQTPIEVDRAQRLFLYLRDLAELCSRSVRDVADYEEAVWLTDLPAGRYGWSLFPEDQPDTDPESWMEMQEVRRPLVHPFSCEYSAAASRIGMPLNEIAALMRRAKEERTG